MNKNERAYAGHLEDCRKRGEVCWWLFEPLALDIGLILQKHAGKPKKDRLYKPDFLVVRPTAVEIHETKGRFGDGPGGFQHDAKEKLLASASRFWFWPHFAVTPTKTGWHYAPVPRYLPEALEAPVDGEWPF